VPVGVVGLSDIHPRFRTALLWYALGQPRFAGRGLTGRAAAEVVRLGFHELELAAIQAWAVEGNEASLRILERIGFRAVGRQRRCHLIDGQLRDRLLFDIVPRELARRPRKSARLTRAHETAFSLLGVDGALLSGIPWG
jgi:RimJ/RimL family protein N-acetyltransferase